MNEEEVPKAGDTQDQKYGWLSLKPRKLQSCLSSRWVLFYCCIYVGMEGFVAIGLSAVVITSIEKRYFLQSKQLGAIVACYEVGSLILTVFVSYYGSRHKPKYLGIGSFVVGIGCLLFALPHILVGSYHPIFAKNSDLCQQTNTTFNITTAHINLLNTLINKTTTHFRSPTIPVQPFIIINKCSRVTNKSTTNVDFNVTNTNTTNSKTHANNTYLNANNARLHNTKNSRRDDEYSNVTSTRLNKTNSNATKARQHPQNAQMNPTNTSTKKRNARTNATNTCLYRNNTSKESEHYLNSSNANFANQQDCRLSQWYYIFIFMLGQAVIGAGASSLYNLGSKYLDECVSRKNSGLYLAIFYAFSALGPGAGFLLGGYFLTVYVDVNLPDDITITPNDKNWVGAWWLGYVTAAVFFFLISASLLGFPQELPNVKELREQKKNAVDSLLDEQKPHTSKQLLIQFKYLVKNNVFLFTTIAGSVEALGVSGATTFFPKFLQSQYHLNASDASFYAGLIVIPAGCLGMLLGGYFIRRFQWTCANCTKACSLISFIALFPVLIILVHCPNKDIAGITTPYNMRTEYDVLDVCSAAAKCGCTQNRYIPVCSKEDQITYFSPCHAGCTRRIKQEGKLMYTNCSCLPSYNTTAYSDGCVKSCGSMGYFLAVVFLLIVFIFLTYVPAITITIRCVPESQGSFALGIQQLFCKIFAFIPAPIIFGALLDSVCILSETDKCDDNAIRNCLEYNNENLSYMFFAIMMTSKVLSFLFFTLVWLVYKPTSPIRTQLKLNEENIKLTSITT